jgi:CheY-like chemotaxis protein
MSRATAPDARSRTILIVDDMPANLGVLVDPLEGMGHRVLVAQDGEEALGRASLMSPDLILLGVDFRRDRPRDEMKSEGRPAAARSTPRPSPRTGAC